MKKILALLVTFFLLTAFTLAPNNYIKEGFKAFKAHNYEKAIALYNRVLAENPKNTEALNGKGVVLAFSGKPLQGLKYINKAIKLKPDYWTAYFNAGLANELAGNYPAAIKAYQCIISADRNNTWSYYGIACSYGRMGDAMNAVKYLKKAISLDQKVKEKARTEKDFYKIRQNANFIKALK